MANTKISELTAVTALAGTDVFPVVDVSASTTNKVSVTDLLRNAPAGSAGAPSIANADDQDTGILFPAANSIGVSTGGAQRLVIDSSGKVGIGATSPSATLHAKSGTTDVVADFESTDANAWIQIRDSSTTDTAVMVGAVGDDMRLRAGSNERVRIDSSGKVGIGTTTAGRTLSVDGSIQVSNSTSGFGLGEGFEILHESSGSTYLLNRENAETRFYTNNAERMRVDSSGRLLVGTSTSPSGGDGHAQNARLLVRGRVGVDADSGRLNLQRGSAAVNGSSIGSISFTDSSNNIYARIESFGDGTTGTDDYPGRITFSTTADNASSVTERLRIDSSGRLLVGTTSAVDSGATSSLQVVNTSTAIIALGRNDSSISAGNDLGAIRFYGNDGGSYQECAEIVAEADGDHANNDKPTRLVFSTTTDGASSSSERMRIDSSGRLLLGTTTEGKSGADEFTVATSSNTGITIRSGTSSTGDIMFSDGTSGDDEFRGIVRYDHSNNSMQLWSNAFERMRIDSSGRLSVGNTSASSMNSAMNNFVLGSGSGSEGMVIYSGSSNSGFIGFNDAASASTQGVIEYNHSGNHMGFRTADAERMRIDSSGNVGIGTTSPADQLHIHEASSGAANVRFSSTDVPNGFFVGFDSQEVGQIWHTANKDIRIATNNTERMRINSSGNVGIGKSSNLFYRLTFAESSGDTGRIGWVSTSGNRKSSIDCANTAAIRFNIGTSDTERMRIDSSGNVGIGTTSPSFELQVSQTGSASAIAATSDVTSGTASRLLLGNSVGTARATFNLTGGGSETAYLGTEGNFDLYFQTHGAERMRIDGSGRVGIGVSTMSGGAGDVTIIRNSALRWADSDGTQRADIYGDSSSNIVFRNGTSSTERMKIANDGSFRVVGVYNFTLASSANVHVDSGGLIRRVTSSAKYKTNIETIEDSYADALLNCRPVWYQSTCEGDNPDYGWWGFIAEEVAEIDPRLVHWKTTNVTYDEDGQAVEAPCDPEAEGVLYDRFVPHLLNLIKRQQSAIEALETKVAALEAQ